MNIYTELGYLMLPASAAVEWITAAFFCVSLKFSAFGTKFFPTYLLSTAYSQNHFGRGVIYALQYLPSKVWSPKLFISTCSLRTYHAIISSNNCPTCVLVQRNEILRFPFSSSMVIITVSVRLASSWYGVHNTLKCFTHLSDGCWGVGWLNPRFLGCWPVSTYPIISRQELLTMPPCLHDRVCWISFHLKCFPLLVCSMLRGSCLYVRAFSQAVNGR